MDARVGHSGENVMDSYKKLCEAIAPIIQLQSAMQIVHWDMLTMIPPRGLQQRADQLAIMNKILHQMITDPNVGKMLVDAESNIHSLDGTQQREVELIRRNWEINTAVPEKLVSEKAKQTAIATSKWRKAKNEYDWSIFLPELEKLLDLSKQSAELLMKPTNSDNPYGAMLSINEPGLSSKEVTKVFNELRSNLVPLVRKFENACRDIRTDFTKLKVPINIQRRLVTDLVNYVGFDTITENAGGRVDESEHPFTSSFFDDTRMTIHYYENNIHQAIFGGLHEAGHSIQGQSRNPDWKWMALGEKCSAGINESQAKCVENIIGRSFEFWNGYYERFQEITEGIFHDVSIEEFVRAANLVKPTKIRVTADEMTYSLHIIIRYEIEQALFSDSMEPKDIPQVWNEKYEKYLGVEIENDAEGALQDTHWAWAYWGYFPTYTLGNIYSGMILHTLNKEIPNWKQDLANGSVDTPINWLKTNVHFLANRYDPSEMLEKITGMKLTAQPFLDYLEGKYASLFL